MNRNDILWKSILEDIFDDFLRFFCPEADEVFDFTKPFVYLDKELEQLFPPEDDQFASRYADKLVKVYTIEGDEEWILVHIEVQGFPDKQFAARMFTYYYRIWDKYRKRTTAFAILTDENQNFRPCKFEQAFLGMRLCFEFNSVKILDYSDECLEASDNPFAQVILTVKAALMAKKVCQQDLYDFKTQLARRLLNSKFSKYKIGKLMNFLKFYVRFDSDEYNELFESEITTLEKSTTMSIEEAVIYVAKEEGLEKGRMERNQVFVKNLLKETSFSVDEIARLAGVPVDFVQEVKDNLQ
ncbi:Rpn family recombination-promoting nuclease/putative transposase [Dyadobacter luticola]|uniref:Transposase (putative) YhgA-like domain-containing protein n=1 Tax=Dyadobacter luticola TaxID=1979387 RepID=A0A5R9KXQ5_9BACT|nr:Rpn family recombination-promoting nuclease/putative transposase [Dyadobacter luticola]TLV00857.1 hypothetical protein FEN17_15385 [Dyadobacter luticola]